MSSVVTREIEPHFAPAEGLFFDNFKPVLEELFTALGREHEWHDNPVDLTPYTQAKWVGVEHGNSVEKDQFTDEQQVAAAKIFPRLGLTQEVLPPEGSFEQVVIIGGLMRVNRERIKFTKNLVEEGRVSADTIVFWAGQRLREQRDDSQLAMIDLPRLAHIDWVRSEQTKAETSVWSRPFATETELAQLAYFEQHPTAKYKGTVLSDGPRLAQVPQRKILSHTFAADQSPDFTLMNCAAILPERQGGAIRHTSASCAREWLKEIAPTSAADILLVAGNPHTGRNIRELRQITAAEGRTDLSVTVCGPAANPKATTQLMLGEVGRLLYMDAMALQAQIS